MTKLGMTLFVGVIVLILGVGFFIFGSPTTTTFVVTKPETPVETVPTTPVAPAVPTAEFDKAITLNVGDKVAFSDGLNLTLKEINDSRCKPSVQCFWQGELAAVLVVSGADVKVSASEIRLGTVNNKSVTLTDYKFTLLSATEKDASVVVSKRSKI